jgi:hypothetical protein
MSNIQITLVNKNKEFTSGPLATLEQTNGLSMLRYPFDLGIPSQTGKNNKNHWVTFTIRNVDPASTESTTNPTTITIPNAATAVGVLTTAEGVKNLVTNLAGPSSQNGAIFDTLVDTAGQAITNTIVGALFGGNGLRVSPPISNIVSVISLYMPDSLTASYNANYEEMSLTSDLGPLVTTLRAIGSSGVSNLVETIKGIGNNTSTDPNVIQAAVGGLQALGIDTPGLDVANLGTLLQRASGYAINPQLQMVYRGTGLRTFDLSFTFTPKSSDESQNVNDIIQQFRFYSSPSLGQKTGGTVTQSTTDSMFLIPPSIFNIQFYVKGIESKNLPKYGDCILESVQVNHAPNGFAVFDEDGSMVQTQLSLSFREMNILTRDNISDTDTDAQRR